MILDILQALSLSENHTQAPSGPNNSRKFPINSRDFSSHFTMRSWLFSSTLYTKCLDFSSTVFTFSFIRSTWFCRLYFFSYPNKTGEAFSKTHYSLGKTKTWKPGERSDIKSLWSVSVSLDKNGVIHCPYAHFFNLIIKSNNTDVIPQTCT